MHTWLIILSNAVCFSSGGYGTKPAGGKQPLGENTTFLKCDANISYNCCISSVLMMCHIIMFQVTALEMVALSRDLDILLELVCVYTTVVH